MTEKPQSPQSPRFDRGAWLTLIFVLAVLLLSGAVLVYRANLPTDGWISTEPDEFDSFGYIYNENVLGIPSGLQAGDDLVAIEGISLDQKFLSTALFGLQPVWQAGETVQYTVLRAGQSVDLQVPLVRWKTTLLQRVIGSPRDIIYSLSYLLLLGTGLVAFFKRPDIPAARAILVLGAAWMSIHLTLDPAPLTVHDDVFPIAAYGGSLLIIAAFTILIPPAFIRFALVFPNPKPILARRPWLAYLPYLVGSVVVYAFLSGAFVYGYIWTGLSVILAIGILIHNAFTMQDAVSQAQLRWGLGGMILGLGIFLTAYISLIVTLNPPLENLINTVSPMGFGVMGVTLGIAVLRYRLFDIDFIIRRTLQYTLLTALLALIYFGGVVLLQEVFGWRTGERNSSLVTVLSTLAIALLFNPLRIRVQRLIDRQFYRRKYQAEQTLAEFSATVQNEVNMDRLTDVLLEVVEDTVQPAYASLWLREDRRSGSKSRD